MGPNIGSRAQDVRTMVAIRIGRQLTKTEVAAVDVMRRAGMRASQIAAAIAPTASSDETQKGEGR